MQRKGKYTRRVTRLQLVKRRARRGLRWWRQLSRLKKIMLLATPIVVVVLVIPFITYLFFARDISDIDRLMNRNTTGVVLYAKDGKTILYDTGQAGRRDLVPLDKISTPLKQAVVASEDKDFYDHNGFSFFSTLRAVYTYIITGGRTYGGSTLTQQLAKITLLSDQRSFLREYQTFSVSVAIEYTYTKDQILDMYLNSAYFGGSAFGIQDAAKQYFDTTPDQLTLAQSSMLIGLLPAPNAYSPVAGDPVKAVKSQKNVLRKMVTTGVITQAEADAAAATELAYASQADDTDSKAPHFVQMVLDQLYEKYGEETARRSGYQVTTTLDADLQKQLTDAISAHIGYIQANGGSNAAGVAIDPKSGNVLALVGSADWNNQEWGKVNVATTPRQPGSSFKPIYYSAALADGTITPATILHDVPTDFGNYQPLDADKRFRGDVTVRSALDQSLNIPSVEVLQEFGIDRGVEAAKKLGITTIDEKNQYGLSLALGSAEVPLVEMTNAYAAFANEGQQYKVTTIQEISDKFNVPIFRAPQAVTTPAISPEGAFLISNILSDNAARAPIFGSSLTVPGRTAAVKTGTTNDNRDAWTIGYTPQLALGIWVGNNDNAAMLNGGSGMAGPIWVNTMKQALADTPDTAFVVPAGITQRAVCYGQEALASRSGYGTFNEYFLSTALPSKTCSPAEPPKPKEEEKPEESTTPIDNSDTNEGTTPPATNGNSGSSGPGSGGNGNGGSQQLLPNLRLSGAWQFLMLHLFI